LVILFLILAIGFSVGLIYSLQKILFRGELIYLLYFFCLYLPFYATLQAIFFKYTGSFEVVFLTKYLKEILVFISLVSWILYRRDILSHPIKLNLPDYLFLIFVLYALLYTLFPIGPSSFLNKAIYFKNILMLALMYGFGRLIILSKSQSQMLLKLIMGVAIGAFFVNLGERAFGIHFQNLIGYVDWNLSFNGT